MKRNPYIHVHYAADTGGTNGAAKDKLPDEPKAKVSKAKPKLVKVRVAGGQPLLEDGTVYHPKRQEPNGKGGLVNCPADEFEVTEERREALGDHVEDVK